MSGYQLIPDKQYPNAVTVHTPEGKKIRISEYMDGRLRIRLAKAGPALVQECYLTGAGEDVIFSIVPEGWTRKKSNGRGEGSADEVSRKSQSSGKARTELAGFDHLKSVSEKVRTEELVKKDEIAEARRAKHASAMAITEMVMRVLNRLRETAFKQIKWETHAQSNENESYYFWGIGHPADIDGYRLFWTAIQVDPAFSANGAIEALVTSLKIPNTDAMKELAGQFELPFNGSGATASCAFRHAPTEEALTEALLNLFPPDYLKALLEQLHHEWRVQV